MATIAGAFLIPHDPLIVAAPDAPDAAQAARVMAGFSRVAARLKALSIDTVITIGDDHYGVFDPHCIPQCLIGIGDVYGPLEPWLGFERRPIPNNQEMAQHILNTGYRDGINWAFAKSLTVDHSAAVPYFVCYDNVAGVRTIPIYLNDGVPPVITNQGAYAIGCSIANAVRSWPGDERVAIVGTGGCSHWVGEAGMGNVNDDFDHEMLEIVRRGDLAALMALNDENVLASAGNGALEFKNWICAMAAAKNERADIFAYETVPAWVAGLAFAELV